MSSQVSKKQYIPRVVYSYWHDKEKVPKVVRLCLNKFKKLNPSWKFVLLSEDDLPSLDIPDTINTKNLKKMFTADIVRCLVLARHGGVWADASIVPIKPLEAWVDVTKNCIQGFHVPWKEEGCDKIIENWHFAAPKDCKFMEEWTKQFIKAVEMGFPAYRQEVATEAVTKCADMEGLDNYLGMHAAFCATRFQHPDTEFCLRPSVGTPDTPFHYLTKFNWSSFPSVCKLALQDYSNFSEAPFVKLRGCERNITEFFLKSGMYVKNSLLEKALDLPQHQSLGWHVGLLVMSIIAFSLVVSGLAVIIRGVVRSKKRIKD